MTMLTESSKLPSPTKLKSKVWRADLGLKIETISPFLGLYRPFMGRCCQVCTPKSLESYYYKRHTKLGFHNALHITEENTRFRGWLVRRLCSILFILDCPLNTSMSSNLLEKIYQHSRVQSVIDQDVSVKQSADPAASNCGLFSGSRVHAEVLQILSEIQKPLSQCLIRLRANSVKGLNNALDILKSTLEIL